jgi:hypothetical protein
MSLLRVTIVVATKAHNARQLLEIKKTAVAWLLARTITSSANGLLSLVRPAP